MKKKEVEKVKVHFCCVRCRKSFNINVAKEDALSIAYCPVCGRLINERN